MADEHHNEQQRPKRRPRQRNNGLRKLCKCARRNWSKCPDSWYFNFKPRGGPGYMFSLDRELGRHIKDKDEARKEADRIRTAIREGTFIRAADRLKAAAATPDVPTAATLDSFAKTFVERRAQASGKKSWKNDRDMLKRLGEFRRVDGVRLGDMPLSSITEDDLEAFHAALRNAGRAASTLNGYVQIMKQAFKWAARKGYLAQSPITEDAELQRSPHAQRMRRLAPDAFDKQGKLAEPSEERRLLAAAGPGLQRLIIGALETGCRRGELLSLQWRDVDLVAGEIRIRADNAKDGEDRVLPISARLAAVLEMAKIDPAGKEYKPEHFVFGEIGQKVKTIKKAWETAILKANGHEPVWVRSALAPASRLALRQIDLHFHDLRHEAGSRWLEAGWPLHKVRDMLGHASIDQTDTYLNTARKGLRDEMRRMDEARARCNPVINQGDVEHPVAYNSESNDVEKSLVN